MIFYIIIYIVFKVSSDDTAGHKCRFQKRVSLWNVQNMESLKRYLKCVKGSVLYGIRWFSVLTYHSPGVH